MVGCLRGVDLTVVGSQSWHCLSDGAFGQAGSQVTSSLPLIFWNFEIISVPQIFLAKLCFAPRLLTSSTSERYMFTGGECSREIKVPIWFLSMLWATFWGSCLVKAQPSCPPQSTLCVACYTLTAPIKYDKCCQATCLLSIKLLIHKSVEKMPFLHVCLVSLSSWSVKDYQVWMCIVKYSEKAP